MRLTHRPSNTTSRGQDVNCDSAVFGIEFVAMGQMEAASGYKRKACLHCPSYQRLIEVDFWGTEMSRDIRNSTEKRLEYASAEMWDQVATNSLQCIQSVLCEWIDYGSRVQYELF